MCPFPCNTQVVIVVLARPWYWCTVTIFHTPVSVRLCPLEATYLHDPENPFLLRQAPVLLPVIHQISVCNVHRQVSLWITMTLLCHTLQHCLYSVLHNTWALDIEFNLFRRSSVLFTSLCMYCSLLPPPTSIFFPLCRMPVCDSDHKWHKGKCFARIWRNALPDMSTEKPTNGRGRMQFPLSN